MFPVKLPLLSLLSVVASLNSYAATANNTSSQQTVSLPMSVESVFSESIDDPNVLFYYGVQALNNGKTSQSLAHFLNAAKYQHIPSIKNAMYLIKEGIGVESNHDDIISFLRYFAEDHGNTKGDLFAQRYLGDYYSGNKCVWLKGVQTECAGETLSMKDLERGYFYFDASAKQGDERSQYVVGMMNLLGRGTPRNVPLAIDKLSVLADKGYADVSYIIGKIYQDGYWVSQDFKRATDWFKKGMMLNHVNSTLMYAKNTERALGFTSDLKEKVKLLDEVVAAYLSVANNVVSNDIQVSEARYRLGLLYAGYKELSKAKDAVNQMMMASKSGENEYTVLSLLWLGNDAEKYSLSKAVDLYKQAESVLLKQSIDVQQKHSIVWLKIAQAYANGQDFDLRKDERKYAFYMNKNRTILAKTFVPIVNIDEYQGYHFLKLPK